MRFSERYGYKPVKEVFQIESMDKDLRNGIWSVLHVFIWSTEQSRSAGYGYNEFSSKSNPELFPLCQTLWLSYFKQPIDELGSDWGKSYQSSGIISSLASGMRYMISLILSQLIMVSINFKSSFVKLATVSLKERCLLTVL